MDLVVRLQDWQEPLEAYFPMLYTSIAGRSWPSRPANLKLTNVYRPDKRLNFDLEDLKSWRDNIYQAIHRRKAVDRHGQEIDLNNDRGIDIIGNMVEASDYLSPDPSFYGNLHNQGHRLSILMSFQLF